MGFATSGILGAKLAAPDRPRVAVVGDGSFLMTPHALATAVEYDIPVVWVVWNNQGYCSIRDIQHGMFAGRHTVRISRRLPGRLGLPRTPSSMLARSRTRSSPRSPPTGRIS